MYPLNDDLSLETHIYSSTNMVTESIKIEGMSCAGACVRSVRQALSEVKGVRINEVGLGYASVSYDKETDLPHLTRQAIQEAGFRPVS